MFKLDPELEDFRNEARKLAEREFAPRAAHWDEAEEFPAANRDKLAELGYLGMFIPEEYGGSGAPVIQGTVFLEEMARVCFNTALVSQLYLNGPSRAISVLGSDEQKKRFLPDMAAGKKFIAIAISEPEAGSAVTDLRTTATRDGDGWVLNGNKCWSTGAHVADYALVFCRFGKASGAKGIGAFVVDLKKPGARIGHISLKMGGRGLTEAEIILENYKAGPEDVLVEGGPGKLALLRAVDEQFRTRAVWATQRCAWGWRRALSMLQSRIPRFAISSGARSRNSRACNGKSPTWPHRSMLRV